MNNEIRIKERAMKTAQFLSAIGIEIWQARTAIPGAKERLSYATYVLSDGQIRGYFLLDNIYDVSLQNLVLRFLQEYFAAVNLKFEPAEISLEEISAYKILLLGHALAEKLLPQNPMLKNIIVSYHPQQLIEQPLLKRQAWDHLLQFTNAAQISRN